MDKIKTREVAEKGIKTLDRTAVAGERMKSAYIRTREKALGAVDTGQENPNEYAGSRAEYAAGDISREVIHDTGAGAQRAVQRGREAFRKQREKSIRERAREDTTATKQPPSPNADAIPVSTSGGEARPHQIDDVTADAGHLHRPAPDTPSQVQRGRWRMGEKSRAKAADVKGRATGGGPRIGRQAAGPVAEPVKSAERTGRATVGPIRKTVRQTGRTVKTAERSTKAVAKTTGRTARTTVKTTQRMAQTTGKAAAKAVAAAGKASAAAGRALVAAIAAGGGAAGLVIVIICLTGLLAGSVFGIFFSGEDTGAGQTMQTAVREIDAEYQDRLAAIRAGNAHDILKMSGTRAAWREVLAVYAVKTATGPDRPQDVASMDDSKKALLKDIFWTIDTISSRTANETRDITTEIDDGNGNIVETTAPAAVTVLYISVGHKTAEEMADYYGFDAGQRAQLAELLADEYQGLWSTVLYGIGTGGGRMVEVALSQVGNVGGEPYWSWYGFGSRVEWCACFVSWCANESGYIEAGIIPKFASCTVGSNWFKDRGLWRDNGYEPRPGDIVFFDWDGQDGGQDGIPDHAGIVEKVEDGRVYTVEGNSGDTCQENHYSIGYYEIYGYGTPVY